MGSIVRINNALVEGVGVKQFAAVAGTASAYVLHLQFIFNSISGFMTENLEVIP